jgi:L-2-hydroxyglutarate oxidase LhgO
MKAKNAYELIHTTGSRVPALLADPSTVDHVEVVEIESGEVVLFWDLPTDAARRVVRQMREDLHQLQADEFMSAWQAAEAEASR